ncbi:hypothetical protein GLOIN_2v1767755 [Rhizophagus irregularis DAOM 181602=DAOM 197198]|uniref:Uncharacterized protein n=1 Tax=Rhizophagus irregularis (strain DAOM 181602 / DAOM 197198 / MUCL 43194) TaxID=747089 RepID=A0A2P4QIH5_RHIID|nr:hypothetical protein GLOIN_2v1767755 [Rhizophagus irregularis DAOM 181602=DAOM 197198]POG77447.1 hypothetical protein GLOIN_2v1767755 [Rhizophagus irregularis DAOM 181602=DAOM 197198]|eukprot:XP_025184313.1 hypothetical protein GLOIN_2v1767755 [Rhizophagus irregularis DAOM 181602=DAOM 197198]
MENILNPNFFYSYNILFNSYYGSPYSSSNLLNGYQYESSDLPIFEFYGSLYDSFDLFLEDHDILNEIQIGNYNVSDDKDRHFNYQEQEYDDSEYEEEENKLELNDQGMEFET